MVRGKLCILEKDSEHFYFAKMEPSFESRRHRGLAVATMRQNFNAMNNLDEILWNSRGDEFSLDSATWRRVAIHVFGKLESFLSVPLGIHADASFEEGFHFSFVPKEPTPGPLQLRYYGRCGCNSCGDGYTYVQGFLFLYSGQNRLIAPGNKNHLYLRYASNAAPACEWDMMQYTGPSDWQSFGWSVDHYGEFEGLETWDSLQESPRDN